MKFETKKKINDAEIKKTPIAFYEGARACYLYTQYLIIYQKFCQHPLWPQNEIFVSSARDHHGKWYFFVQDWPTVEKYLERFLNKPSELSFMDEYLTRERDKGVARLKNVDADSLPNDKLRDLMEFYFEQFNNLMVTAGTLRKVDRALLRRFGTIFADKTEMDTLIATVAIPKKQVFVVREERAVFTLAEEVEYGRVKRNSEAFKREVQKVHDSFAWGMMGYFNELPKSVSDYEEEVDKALAEGPSEKLRLLDERIADDVWRKVELAASLRAKDRALVEVASYATYLKDLFKSSENELEYFAEPLFEECAKRTGYSTPFIKDLHPKEILGLLSGDKVDEKLVAERVEHNVIIGMPGKINILVGKEAEAFERRYLTRSEENQTEFKGRVASRGFAKGAVKVVLGGKDFAKLNKGDILVVSNTSPDFVPIMGKAAAIVAEEGGLTAHVSVVSREFGIPCVVGIPHITEILKDGKMVEVDANKGIVKIIK